MDSENPVLTAVEQLKPTSGRKLWKIRHHKSLQKKEKKYRSGMPKNN